MQNKGRENNILEIKHSKFGIEKFPISEAKYNLYQTKDNIWEFTISFSTNSALKRSKELVNLIHAKPNLEATIILQPDNLKLESGKKLTQKLGYDYERDEHLSIFYYAEHENVEDLILDLIEVESHQIKANGTGKTFVAGTNGTDFDTEIIFKNTTFKLKKNFKRTFS